MGQIYIADLIGFVDLLVDDNIFWIEIWLHIHNGDDDSRASWVAISVVFRPPVFIFVFLWLNW